MLWLLINFAHGKVSTSTGAWNLPPGYQYYLDSAFAQAVAQLAANNGVLTTHDVGAGKGLYLNFWRSCGLKATGEDGELNVEWTTGGLVKHHDVTTYSPTECDSTFQSVDMVTAMEIAEHIPSQWQGSLLKHLDCLAQRILVMSWAHPGQVGQGHVSLATSEQVEDKMRPYGWALEKNSTRDLRSRSRIPWIKANAMVFTRIGQKAPLARPGARPHCPGKECTSEARMEGVREALSRAMVSLTEFQNTSSRTAATSHFGQKKLNGGPLLSDALNKLWMVQQALGHNYPAGFIVPPMKLDEASLGSQVSHLGARPLCPGKDCQSEAQMEGVREPLSDALVSLSKFQNATSRFPQEKTVSWRSLLSVALSSLQKIQQALEDDDPESLIAPHHPMNQLRNASERQHATAQNV